MAWDALNAGFVAHRFHMRTCGGTAHLCKTLYHAGLTSDLRAFSGTTARAKATRFAGVSHRLFARRQRRAETRGRTGRNESDCTASARFRRRSIWPPGSAESASSTTASTNAVFSNGCASASSRPGVIRAKELKAARTLYEIDDKITAPSFGFEGADHYYATQSAQELSRSDPRPDAADSGEGRHLHSVRNFPAPGDRIQPVSAPDSQPNTAGTSVFSPAAGRVSGWTKSPFEFLNNVRRRDVTGGAGAGNSCAR